MKVIWRINKVTNDGLYKEITTELIKKNKTITTMESCTGGLIASYITDTEGASKVMKGAAITYSNEAKIMAGVPQEIIQQYGVYSKETAKAMAEAVLDTFNADVAVGVTGTFGNVDPNNNDSVPGKAFYCIKIKSKYNIFEIELPKLLSRREYKEYTVGMVGEAIRDIIKEL